MKTPKNPEQQEKPHKHARLPSSRFMAIAIAVIVMLWTASGLFATHPPKEDLPLTLENVASPVVKVQRSNAQAFSNNIVLFGSTESYRSVLLKAQTEGRVESIVASEGDMVRAGDPIIRLAMDDREARRTMAKAALKQWELEYDVAKALSQQGHRSETKLAEAKARLESAKADLHAIELEISFTTIKAPFDGLLQTLDVEEGDLVKRNDLSVGTLIDVSKALAVVNIPEQQIKHIERGSDTVITLLDERVYTGELSYISRVSDPTTRTYRVEVTFSDENEIIPQGMTVEISIPKATVNAHMISPSVLSLSDSGEIGVKALGENNIVEFYEVEILHQDKQGMWVDGLPESIRLITLGQAFLAEGSTARTADDSANEARDG